MPASEATQWRRLGRAPQGAGGLAAPDANVAWMQRLLRFMATLLYTQQRRMGRNGGRISGTDHFGPAVEKGSFLFGIFIHDKLWQQRG